MKIEIKFISTALTLILLSTSNLMAQDTTKVEANTPAPLVISGQVDAYYRASSNKVNISKTSYTSQQGSATIGMANVAISKDNGKIGFMADLMFGPRADETNGFNFITQNLSKKSNESSWNGSALYLNYAFSPKFILAARGELFNDKDSVKYSAAENVITALTLSGNIKIDAFTIIPEIRFDSAKKTIWQDETGKAKDGETSFILAAVYKF